MGNLKSNEYKMRAVCDLFPYMNNARTHSEEQIAQIARSIEEFGFTNPILIDENCQIIAGHGRLYAAKELELSEVPTLAIHSLSDEQKRGLVIADNQLALNADWNYELLREEIEALKTDEFDVDLLGFSSEEMAEIYGLLNSELDVPALDDEGDGMFKVKVIGATVDKEDVLNTLKRAIEESGIAGVSIEAA